MRRGTAAEFAEIAASLHGAGSVEETVEMILEYTLQAVDCTHAAVTFIRGSKVETMTATDPIIEKLDAAQMELGEGPDVELLHGDYSVLSNDLGSDPRWPRWGEAAAAIGVHSMVGARLYTGAEAIGSLNAYDVHPHHFTEADEGVVQILARHAAIAVTNVHDTQGLHRALDSRKVIGIAEGILMERFGLDDSQAFEVLRRYSSTRNIKLRDVAQIVVETRSLPE